MFFLYIIWSFLFLMLNYTHQFLENNFLVKNNPFLFLKRTFKYISFFEKLILVLFYKKGWFEKSIANLTDTKDIINYRREYFPIINSFHLALNKVFYDVENLNYLVKQFKYYKKNLFFKKIIKILNFCFYKNKNLFINFLIIQNLFIKKYYNLNSYFYFNNKKELNLIKLNNVFFVFLLNSKSKLVYFNLDQWVDWYNYNFDKKINSFLFNNFNNKNYFNKKLFFKKIILVYKYKIRISKLKRIVEDKSTWLIFFKFNLNNFFKIKINKEFKNLMKYYLIKFSESSVSKYINTKTLKLNNINYLRKNRIFNKGRYSRNRQLYRTGVYWCLWLNIIMVYGLYFIFYRFTFNFGYFWWGLLFLAYSTIFSRIVKYNFYNINYLIKEFNLLIYWYGYIFINIFNVLDNLLKNYFNILSIYNYFSIYKKKKLNFVLEYFIFLFISFYNNIKIKYSKMKTIYIWQGMKEKDNSFLRYKTIFHWIKEIYRLSIN